MEEKEFLDNVELVLNALEVPADLQQKFLDSLQGFDDDKKLKTMQILVFELEKFKQQKEEKFKIMTNIQEKAENFGGNEQEFLDKIKKEIDSL